MPGFTAETAFGRGEGRYARAAAAPAHDRALLPQQRLGRVDTLTDGDAPATTCTCPCCQTIRGKLVCC